MDSNMAEDKICCENCKQAFDKMKRCTRCRDIFYCSRDCQITDWARHKEQCNEHVSKYKDGCNPSVEKNVKEKTPIPSESMESNSSRTQYGSRINFEKAAQDLKKKSKDIFGDEDENVEAISNEQPKTDGKFYYHNDVACYDVPDFSESQPQFQISVKCDKQKHKISVSKAWTGEEIFKYLSHSLEIPLEKLKLIHKGKVLTREVICESIGPRSIIQVIGEKSASAEGLDNRDIDVMMKQLGVGRNSAIDSLRQNGDLIDAIISAANKQ